MLKKHQYKLRLSKKDEAMIRKMDLQDAFVAGVEKKLIPLRWGAQKRVAKAAGIFAKLPERRMTIIYFPANHNEFFVGAIRACLCHQKFSEDRACCICQRAANKAGIVESQFFKADSLRKTRPLGWLEYLEGEIDDGTLYERAQKEVKSLQEQIILKQVLLEFAQRSHP